MKMPMLIVATFIIFASCGKEKEIEPSPEVSTGIDSIDKSNQLSEKIANRQQAGIVHHNGAKYVTYLIKKGNNFCEESTLTFGTYSALRFKAILDSSCIYKTSQPSNQKDINKLLGFADCQTNHHANSARFGWNWDNGALHIHAYCYVDSVRIHKEIGTVNVNETFDCTLTLLPKQYVFTMNGKTVIMDRGCDAEIASGYLLYPYFGGDEPASQDIRISIKEY